MWELSPRCRAAFSNLSLQSLSQEHAPSGFPEDCRALCCRLPSLHNLPAPDSKIEFPHWPHTPSSGSTMYPSSTTWIFFSFKKNLLLISIRVYHAVRMWASLCDGVHGAFLPLWDRTWVTRLVRQACLPSRLSGKQALVLFFNEVLKCNLKLWRRDLNN